MCSSALVHMAVKYWKFRGSKYNWETVSGQRKGLFSCWVPWGTSLLRFASVGAGSGGSCPLSLLPSHLRSPSPASLALGNDVMLPLLCWGAGQLGWFGFSITLKPSVFESLKPCPALLLVLSCHPMAPWSREQRWRRGTMTRAEFLQTVEICRWIKTSMHLGRLIWARAQKISKSLKKTKTTQQTKQEKQHKTMWSK